MSREISPYHGLLIVDKPGHPSTDQPTSHDVVASVRRWSGQQRIGHTGTLDPMASGVLALCLGRATRLVEYYQGHDKQYVADIALGTATDTYDAAGTVTDSAPVPDIGTAELEQTLEQFRGETLQTPPAYSAIKQQGEALHRKARRGESVQAAPRQINIRRLDLLEFESGNIIRLRVLCSAGAYIRSLAYDLGIALGTCAHLSALRREAAGPFTLEQAHSLEHIKETTETGDFKSLLLPMGTGLNMPRIYPDPESITRLGYGQQIILPGTVTPDTAMPDTEISDTAISDTVSHKGDVDDVAWKTDQLAQAIAPDGSLAGIIRCIDPATSQQTSCVWRAAKWLLTS